VDPLGASAIRQYAIHVTPPPGSSGNHYVLLAALENSNHAAAVTSAQIDAALEARGIPAEVLPGADGLVTDQNDGSWEFCPQYNFMVASPI
jgi:hypothetical protein